MGKSVEFAEKIKMTKLRDFIDKYLSSLLDEYDFLLKESKNSDNSFYGESVLVASSEVEIFIAIERDEITADFRSLFDKRKNNWYSSDVIFALLGHTACLAVLNHNNATLLRDKLPEILTLFRESKIKETLKLLDEIEDERSRRK
jgi:hypothetical protein